MKPRTEIILYIMAGIVGGAAFIFTHPPLKWPSGPEQVPVQASVDRPEVSAQRFVSSHPLPGTPSSATSSGTQTPKKPVKTNAGNAKHIFNNRDASSAFASVRDDAGASSGDVPAPQEDLNRAFEKFLISQGLPTESLHREIPSPSAKDKKASLPVSEAGAGLDPVIVERLKDDYPITDARLQENGEVWIRINSTDIDKVKVDEMMAAAAGLHGNSATPVKVVVWAGNRPRAIRTFFGDPIF